MADGPQEDPVLRNGGHHNTDQAGKKFVEKTGQWQEKAQSHKPQPKAQDGDKDKKDKKPAGGFDATPVPHASPGYTLKFTFHRAENLPFADINTISSDPYVLATLKTDLQKRHKQDPDLRFRTPTIHRNTNPAWNTEWIVANVPSSGFFLKCRLYDEDPADHDDRLGNVHVNVNSIHDGWTGIKEQSFDIKKRMGSKRAYLIRGCAALVSSIKMGGEMVISVENLGRTPGKDGGRMYTIGPLHWSRHFSPLIGRLTGVKDNDDDDQKTNGEKKKAGKYKSVAPKDRRFRVAC